jgi:hypothetical protein
VSSTPLPPASCTGGWRTSCCIGTRVGAARISPPDYPPPEYWAPGRGSRRSRSDEELERHLVALEEELARLREELAAARRGEGGSG